MLLICLTYILVSHLLISIKNRTYWEYVYYWDKSDETFSSLIKNITIGYKGSYILTLLEEIGFRLPLLYYDNYILYYSSLIIFVIQHHNKNKSSFDNVIIFIHTLILGLLFSNIAITYGLGYSICLHLFNNLLARLDLYSRTVKYQSIWKSITS